MNHDDRFNGKTYGDFLFRPQKGIVDTRKSISLSCKLTDSLRLELPVVSSNMDSVTEAQMAKAVTLLPSAELFNTVHAGAGAPTVAAVPLAIDG